MVFGRSMAVTRVPPVSQCADMQRMASGRGSSLPAFSQARPNPLSSMPFIGEPWPTKSTGIRELLWAFIGASIDRKD
jgi:hypothetical protein